MFKEGIYKEGAIFGKPLLDNVEVPENFKVEDVATDSAETTLSGSMLDGATAIVTAGINGIRETDKQIIIDLTTKEGPLRGFLWKNEGDVETLEAELGAMEVAEVNGFWNEFPKGSGNFSLHVKGYEESNLKIEDLLPYVNESREDLVKELFYYISLMSEEIQDVTKKVLEEVWDEFVFIPAARGMHHHQYGGLLQHTVENLRIAHAYLNTESLDELMDLSEKIDRFVRRGLFIEQKAYLQKEPENGRFFCKFNDTLGHHSETYLEMAKLANGLEEYKIDKDVVIFSVIFHDIGKIMEYSYAGGDNERYSHFFPGFEFSEGNKSVGPDMDIHGVRLGHITLGIIFLTRILKENGVSDGNFLLNTLACLSSHHGRLEWGSPTRPGTVEEYIVHISDLIGSTFGSEKLYSNQ